jgi:hypothetical protein
MVRRFEVPARVCYVRVGVGSAVSSRLLLSDREQVRDNELSWVSASQPGSSHIFNEPTKIGIKPIISGLIFFGEHKTTEQTKVLLESDVYLSSPPGPAQL